MKKEVYTILRAAVATMIVVLPTFFSVILLGILWIPPGDAIVFAVMLAVTLPRALVRARWVDVPLAVGLLVLSCAVAIGCGMLLSGDSWLRVVGAVLFSFCVGFLVWVRRFGNTWQVGSIVASMPFMAILVHPVPIYSDWSLLGWMFLAAGIAMVWALAARSLGTMSSLNSDTRILRRSTTGLMVSTRMAIQLGCACTVAFAVALLMAPEHLVWPVLTVLIVHSGTRCNGDVIWKGAQRVVGALVGTGIATLLTGLFSAGDSNAIVVIFAILAISSAVRPYGYVYWSCGITTSLIFLYGYFGQSGSDLLVQRLLGILAGGIIGIAAACIIFPIRTLNLLRLRVVTLLTAAYEVVASDAHGQSTTTPKWYLEAADRELAALDVTARAAYYFGFGKSRQMYPLLGDAHTLATYILTDTEGLASLNRADLGRLANELDTVRRSLASRQTSLIPVQSNGRSVLADLVDQFNSLRDI